jgi:hypothetical protein
VTATGTPVTLRPRSAVEIVDAAIQLGRRAYLPALLIWYCYTIPFGLANHFYYVSTQPGWVRAWLPSAVTWFLLTAPRGVIALVFSDVYLGHPVDVRAALWRTARNVVRLYTTRILRGLLIVLGFAFFIVPGIGYMLTTWMAEEVVVFEEVGGVPAIRRSVGLTKDSIKRVAALWACLILINGAANWATPQFALMLVHQHILPGRNAFLIPVVLAGLLAPFNVATAVILYYDLRIRKEGFDIEVLSRQLSAAPM